MSTRVSSFVLANTAVTAGTYGGTTQHSVVTVDAQGRVTYAANATPSIASTQVTGTFASTSITGLATSATTDTTSAANISSGTLPSGRLSGSYTGITGVGTLSAGSIPTSLISGLATSATTDTTQAGNISGGTLPGARLSGSYTGITGIGTLSVGSIPSSLITGLAASATTNTANASNISSGTLPSGRLTGSYSIDISGNAGNITGTYGGTITSSQVTTALGFTPATAYANTVVQFAGSQPIIEYSANITSSYTISSGKNAISAGPITVNTGVTVTIPDTSRWVIV